MRATERTPGARWGAAALAAAIACAFAPFAFAAYKDTYGEGLKAAKDGRWADVEQKMREALAEESTPNPRLNVSGRRFEAYAPQFFLGIAAYRRGDCESAVRNLEHGPTRAVVADPKSRNTVGDFTALAERGLSECRTKLAAASKPAPPIATPPKPTTPVETRPTQPIASNTPSTPAKPPATTPDPAPAKPVVIAANKPAPKPAEPPKPATPAAPQAPAALASAVENYLRGRYDRVAAADPAQLPDSRAKFHLLLLRSASRHTLSQIQGDSGAQLLAQAEADVRAAKQLQPGKNPDTALFSPRYRAFFQSTR